MYAHHKYALKHKLKRHYETIRISCEHVALDCITKENIYPQYVLYM